MSDEIKVTNNLRYSRCPLCESGNIFRVGKISYLSPVLFSTTEVELENDAELWKCGDCSSGFTQNAIPEEVSARLYATGESGKRWGGGVFKFELSKTKHCIKELESILKPGHKVLDVGSNTGEFLDFARQIGCMTYGLELSLESRKVLDSRGHCAISSFDEIEENSLDVITAFDVVEHMYDVPGFLLSCKKKLKKDGLIVVITGDINSVVGRLARHNWWYVRLPEHIMFPSRRFFDNFKGLELKKWLPTHASPDFKGTLWARFRGIVSGVRHGAYAGYPPFLPDHALIILGLRA